MLLKRNETIIPETNEWVEKVEREKGGKEGQKGVGQEPGKNKVKRRSGNNFTDFLRLHINFSNKLDDANKKG